MIEKTAWGNRIVEAGWLVIAAGLPLSIAPWGRNAFELPKAVSLWGVVAVMGAAWLVGRRTGPASIKPVRPWQFAALAFLAVLALATLFSVNPTYSARGSYDRMQGTLTVLPYLALFLFVAVCLRRQAQVR